MLILVRHGQTAVNAGGRLQGRADAALTDLGRTQAESIAAAVTGAARVVTSPLRRARETADAFGLPVTVDERWVELDYGDLDGLPLAEVPAGVWSHWRSDVTWAPPGGESLVALGARVRAACEELADEAGRHDVVVVSHVSPIKAAVAWALGVGDEVSWRMFLGVASITRIALRDRGPSLVSFNEGSHLTPSG
ncbi:MAG TPA: histidine phosphatase family protein [Acidimicrobiales bacterium]|nr:histidine phosphatase family protein [Acidimicrobiales bacterium]